MKTSFLSWCMKNPGISNINPRLNNILIFCTMTTRRIKKIHKQQLHCRFDIFFYLFFFKYFTYYNIKEKLWWLLSTKYVKQLVILWKLWKRLIICTPLIYRGKKVLFWTYFIYNCIWIGLSNMLCLYKLSSLKKKL